MTPSIAIIVVILFKLSSISLSMKSSTGVRPMRLRVRASSNILTGEVFHQEVRCGTYNLNHLAGPAATAKELNPTSIILPLRLIEGQNTEYVIESTIWDYDSGSDNDVVARYQGTISFSPDMVDGLLAKMQDAPARLEDYYCDAYIATYNGDAKSKVEICVDLYAQNPASGAAGPAG